MKRLLALFTVAVMIGGCSVNIDTKDDDEGIIIRGSVAFIDPNMVYTEGTPETYSDGGVTNGCSSKYLKIGDRVALYDFQRKPVAEGSVTETHHWAKDERSGMVGDIHDHGCLFTYVIPNAPKIDDFEISIPFIFDISHLNQGDLTYHEGYNSPPTYEVPLQRVTVPGDVATSDATTSPAPTATPSVHLLSGTLTVTGTEVRSFDDGSCLVPKWQSDTYGSVPLTLRTATGDAVGALTLKRPRTEIAGHCEYNMTGFTNTSVDLIVDMGFDTLKPVRISFNDIKADKLIRLVVAT